LRALRQFQKILHHFVVKFGTKLPSKVSSYAYSLCYQTAAANKKKKWWGPKRQVQNLHEALFRQSWIPEKQGTKGSPFVTFWHSQKNTPCPWALKIQSHQHQRYLAKLFKNLRQNEKTENSQYTLEDTSFLITKNTFTGIHGINGISGINHVTGINGTNGKGTITPRPCLLL